MRIRRGFTLIELLIVVAIIAILAAIAVPNMLEAQIRSKSARAKSDMRTLSMGVEMFAVDYGRYPYSLGEAVGGRLISSVPADIFRTNNAQEPLAYRYSTLPAGDPVYGPIAYLAAGDWGMFSVGPDGDPENIPNGATSDAQRVYRDYDPTNGTTSLGNIWRTRIRPNGIGTWPIFYTNP